jgi:hypothetical protein
MGSTSRPSRRRVAALRLAFIDAKAISKKSLFRPRGIDKHEEMP